MHRILALSLMVLALAAPRSAAAQTADATRYRAPTTSQGGLGFDGARTLMPTQWTLSLYGAYAKNPVVWIYPDETYEPVIEDQLVTHLGLTAGLWHGIDLGLVLPVLALQRGPTGAGLGDLSGSAVGDLRIVPRVALLAERTSFMSLALLPELVLPTGDAARFAGEPSVVFRPRIAASMPVGVVRVSSSLGMRIRENTVVERVTLGDELDFDAGVELTVFDPSARLPLALLTELSGSTALADPFAGGGAFGLEWLAGARARIARGVDLTLAAGAGLADGVGTPDWRVVVGLTFTSSPDDRDADGIPDVVDACPDEPEDVDGFADSDGCPDPDNDGDGILDVEDGCPNEPETQNMIADDDGCPDSEGNDRDGDGILDEDDACPNVAEDFDNFEDEDGCPEPDNDRDGVVDALDRCPTTLETINGVDDDDGCPDRGEGQTRYVQSDRIELTGSVNFETGKSVIKEESKSLLNQVALQILAHAEIKRVRIEGHTDAVGDEEGNLILSQDRADAVRRYLIQRGVEPKRLEAQGFGEARPIDSNSTSEGRARNRRVEFFIAESVR